MGAGQQALLVAGAAAAPSLAVVGHSLLYTGNGGTNAINTAEIQPDIVIVRDRAGGAGTQWRCSDSVRGVQKTVFPSTNGAEASEATGLTSFDASGFTLGSNTGWNGSGKNMLALVLKKLASALDILSYTGNGVSGRTVAHSLGVVPEMMIVKSHSAFSRSWDVYHSALGNTKILNLDSTNGATTTAAAWNNTSPTSTLFTVGNSTLVNENGQPYIAFLFASLNPGVKVGSFTGDGNTNGPAQTTGFRPRFVIIKRTDTTGSWYVFEDQADPTSPHNTYNVLSGGAVAEATTTNTAGGMDFTSTGFQSIDAAAADVNVNGASYIYLAIG